jgi:hypothetical protein
LGSRPDWGELYHPLFTIQDLIEIFSVIRCCRRLKLSQIIENAAINMQFFQQLKQLAGFL